MTNPKSTAYCASVFAAFLTPDMPTWVLVVLIGAIAAMSLAWYVLLAISVSGTRVQADYISASKLIERLCGGFLVVLGVNLAWDRR